MKLSDQELSAVLAVVSPKGIDYQAGRVCRLLAQGKNRTGILASKCSVGNLADVVLNHINPKITHLGLYIGCVKPSKTIQNQFGQIAGDWIYSFYRAGEAANDDAIGSSPNDWEAELKPVLCNSVEG